jgi:hypothetical protein
MGQTADDVMTMIENVTPTGRFTTPDKSPTSSSSLPATAPEISPDPITAPTAGFVTTL